MSATVTSPQTTQVLWRQVWGLAILQSAISLSYMAYNFAQPQVLTRFNYPELNGYYFVVAGLLSLLIEPLIGYYSDGVQRKLGSRYPVINLGVGMTAMIFMAVALGMGIELPDTLRWIVPVLMVLWVASMKIFQTPAISLLWRYAPPSQLPKANSILILIMGLVGALGPFIRKGIIEAGFVVTFLLGGGLLVLALTLMRQLGKASIILEAVPEEEGAATIEEEAQEAKPNQGTESESVSLKSRTRGGIRFSEIFSLFVVGFFVSVATLPIYFQAPYAIQQGLLPEIELEYVTAIILLVSAIGAVPLGMWAAKFGNQKALVAGLAIMAVLFGLCCLPFNLSGVSGGLIAGGLMILLGLMTALIFNTGIPYALLKVKGPAASFGTGLFFGGGGAAFALISALNLATGGLDMVYLFLAALIQVPFAWMILREDF